MPTERAVENGKAKFLGVFVPLLAVDLFVHFLLAPPTPTSVAQISLDVGLVSYAGYRGSRGSIVLVASLLIALGALVTLVGIAQDHSDGFHRTFIILVGILWSGSGVFLVTSLDIRAYLEHRAGRALVAEDDERLGASRGVQIVGRPCGLCTKRFSSELDAVLCDVCSEPFHPKGCLSSHAQSSGHGA